MPKADCVNSMANISYMQEPSYCTDQPTTHIGLERSAFQPWNQYSMNYVLLDASNGYACTEPSVNEPSANVQPISACPEPIVYS